MRRGILLLTPALALVAAGLSAAPAGAVTLAPHGATFAWSDYTAATPTVYVRNPDGSVLASTPGYMPQLSRDGRYLAYQLGGTPENGASPAHLETMDLSAGTLTPVDVRDYGANGVFQDVSNDDTTVYFDEQCSLYSKPVGGGTTTDLGANSCYMDAPEISPDGTRIAVHDTNGGSLAAGLEVRPFSGTPTLVGGTVGTDIYPTWTSDTQLAFLHNVGTSTYRPQVIATAGGTASALSTKDITFTKETRGFRANPDGDVIIGAGTVDGHTGLWLFRTDRQQDPQLIQEMTVNGVSRPTAGTLVGTSWPFDLSAGAPATDFTATVEDPETSHLRITLSGAALPSASQIVLEAKAGSTYQPVTLTPDGSTLVGSVALASNVAATTVAMRVRLTADAPVGALTATFDDLLDPTLSMGATPVDLLAAHAVTDTTVQQADPTTTTLAATPNPVAVGQPSTLTATVSGRALLPFATQPHVTPSTTPTGSVSFSEGATVLGTAPVDGSGQATLAFTPTTVGAHAITATYSGATSGGTGDAGWASSSGGTTVTAQGPPAAPGLTLVAGDGQVTATVGAPSSDGGSPVTSYTLTLAGQPPVTLTAPGAHVFTGLTDGTPYTATATATNAVGTGPAASAGPVTPLAKPGPPVITTIAPKARTLTISWKPAVSHGAPVTGYTVACRQVKGTDAHSADTGPAATSVALTGLVDNTDYTCTVTAHSAVGDAASSPAPGRPGRLPTVKIKVVKTATKGQRLTITGTAVTGTKPAAKRPIVLTFRKDKTSVRKVVAHATTDKKGRFSFTVTFTASGAYQAQLKVGPATAANSEVFVRRAL